MSVTPKMRTELHPAESRGQANHGWLNSYHSFSFASYYNPQRMGFGRLRVLNDDRVSADRGFGRHPHQDMEIISIPLSGALAHKDSMGNAHVIRTGDVQVMSAGTGVYHSEYNESQTEHVDFLQIWVIPNKQGVEPRYQQEHFPAAERHNRWQQVVSPHAEDAGLWIHQDAWFQLGNFDTGQNSSYGLKGQNTGLYVFVLEGAVQVGEQTLETRDGLAIWGTDAVDFKFTANTELLLMEIPLD